jgi:Fic family protein
MDRLKPPFTVTPSIINLVVAISEHIGRLSIASQQAAALRLNRINRIRTIQGSLAIEGNTLSEEQITAILEGKRVIAPSRDLQEARNAIAAYEHLDNWQASREKDLLNAHALLMKSLVDDAGHYRKGNVGVMKGEQVIHVAPPASRVAGLIKDLLQWLKTSDQHALIASCVFHYEFEFIHPFSDGNGRMGRLWQTLILSQWNPLFQNIPVESLVHEHQAEYYQAINSSTQKTDCATFIEFMLRMILEAITSSVVDGTNHQDTPHVTPHVTPQVEQLLKVLKGEMGRDDLLAALGLSDRKHFREAYLQPALASGLVSMTNPNSPKSPKQSYRITPQGLAVLKPKKRI